MYCLLSTYEFLYVIWQRLFFTSHILSLGHTPRYQLDKMDYIEYYFALINSTCWFPNSMLDAWMLHIARSGTCWHVSHTRKFQGPDKRQDGESYISEGTRPRMMKGRTVIGISWCKVYYATWYAVWCLSFCPSICMLSSRRHDGYKRGINRSSEEHWFGACYASRLEIWRGAQELPSRTFIHHVRETCRICSCCLHTEKRVWEWLKQILTHSHWGWDSMLCRNRVAASPHIVWDSFDPWKEEDSTTLCQEG